MLEVQDKKFIVSFFENFETLKSTQNIVVIIVILYTSIYDDFLHEMGNLNNLFQNMYELKN